MIAITLFWLLLAFILYAYPGYPAILWIAEKLRPNTRKAPAAPQPFQPEVTIVIAAYNERDNVKKKYENTLKLSYPQDKIHQIWVTDGSTDGTEKILASLPGAIVIHHPERLGKAQALNRAVAQVKTPVTLFTDANTMLSPQSVASMVNLFADPRIGCVAGRKEVKFSISDGISSIGEGRYWNYESTVKLLECQTGSVISAAGELFAIRTNLYKPIPPDTILDDFEITLSIALMHYRIAYCPDATATEYGSYSVKDELERKTRIAAGGFQLLSRHPGLLNPFRHAELSFKFVSHKLFRWIVVPLSLLLLPLINLIIILQNGCNRLYQVTLLFMLLTILIALVGFWLVKQNRKSSVFTLPYFIFAMNIAQLKGLVRFIRKSQNPKWKKVDRKSRQF